jgi:S-adenosylmethionine hydrolase
MSSEERGGTPIITLLTDFGLKDGNVGVMKGVILGISPQARLIDLSHVVEPQDVRQAAWILRAARISRWHNSSGRGRSGGGTERRPMAARLGTHLFVAPDNGLVTRLWERAERLHQSMTFVHLDRRERWLAEVSDVFHGRDVFAPVAAHLANGVPLEQVGSALSDPVRLRLPRPEIIPGGVRGVVEHIDHFGNIRTNITRQDLGNRPSAVVHIAGAAVNGLVRTFGERPDGELIALFGSYGDLILAVVNGNAAVRLGASAGDGVEVLTGTKARDPG